MRIFLIVLVLAVVGVVGAVLWLLRDPNAFRPEIASLIKRETGLKVNLGGDVSWRLWPPVQLVVKDVSADWQDPGNAPLVSARVVRLDADLMPLLGANPRLQIHGVAVEGLHARLTQSGDTANWMPPGYTGEAPPPVPIPPPTSTPVPADEWAIDAIDVRDSVVDYVEDGDAYRIDVTKLAIAGIAPDRPVAVDSVFTIAEGDATTSLQATGKVRFDPAFSRWTLRDLELRGESPAIGAPFKATVDADIDVTSETLTLSRAELDVGGVTARVTASGQSILTKPTLTGTIDVPRQDLAKLLASFDIEVEDAVGVRGDFVADESNIALTNAELRYGATTAKGKVAVSRGEPARATFDLDVDRFEVPVADTASGVAVSGGPFPLAMFAAPVATIDPSLDEPLIPLETLREVDWDGRTKVGTLVYDGMEFPNTSIETSNAAGLVKANVALPAFFGGRADAKVSIDARTDEPVWTVSPKLENVQSQALLAYLDQRLDWAALLLAGSDLTMRGNTPRALINSVKGRTTFDGGKGKINIAELKRQVQTIALLAGKDDKVSRWPDVLDYQKLTGTWAVDGKEHDLAMDLDNLSMVAKGSYDPLAQDMDMLVSVTLKSNVEPKPFEVDSLFMDVPLPMRCRGSTEEPQCTPDQDGVKRLVAKALTDPAKVDKAIEEYVPEKHRDAARSLLNLLNPPPKSAPSPAP